MSKQDEAIPNAKRDSEPTRSLRQNVRAGSPEVYPFLRPPIQDDELGRLGDYRVLKLLGTGGMGMVFLAEDIALCRPIALKVMKPDLNQGDLAWQRFLREARLMASIKHDNLVTVFQVGQDGDAIYLAMELLEGESLEDRLNRSGGMDPAEVVRVGREIALGLTAIHARGLIHRDIKPANIWLENRGQSAKDRQPEDGIQPSKRTIQIKDSAAPPRSLARAKILDFGLARAIDDTSITRSGMIVGTPAYMSPEQARGKPVDARSDLFSLGCVMYALCTGREPFQADNTMAQLAALVADAPLPVNDLNPSVPEPLAALIMELLAKDPDERPESAEAVLERLRKMKRPTKGRRKSDATRRLSKRAAGKNSGVARPSWWLGAKLPLLIGGSFFGLAAAILLVVYLAGGFRGGPRPLENGIVPEQARPRTFLTDMQAVQVSNWPWAPPPAKDKGKGPKDKGPKDLPPAPDFNRLSLAGQPTPHGIFMHPGGLDEPISSRTYNLDKKFAGFHARVGLNESSQHSESPVIFQVFGDGKLLWQSNEVLDNRNAQDCHVDIKGVGLLKLQTNTNGEPRGAHAVWFEPFVD